MYRAHATAAERPHPGTSSVKRHYAHQDDARAPRRGAQLHAADASDDRGAAAGGEHPAGLVLDASFAAPHSATIHWRRDWARTAGVGRRQDEGETTTELVELRVSYLTSPSLQTHLGQTPISFLRGEVRTLSITGCDDLQGEPAETSWQTQAGSPPVPPPPVPPVLSLLTKHPDTGEVAASSQPFVGFSYVMETDFSKMKVRASSKGDSGATSWVLEEPGFCGSPPHGFEHHIPA